MQEHDTTADRGSPEGKPKVVCIREEYVTLTGSFLPAVILSQMEHWQHTKDRDEFLAEERARKARGIEDEEDLPSKGWIYKSAKQISQDTMLGISRAHARRQLELLVELGFLLKRTADKGSFRRTNYYRLNLVRLEQALSARGYGLVETYWANWERDCSIPESSPVLSQTHGCVSEEHPLHPDGATITETTTEITNKEDVNTPPIIPPREDGVDKKDKEASIPENYQRDYEIVRKSMPPPLAEKLVEFLDAMGAANTKRGRVAWVTKYRHAMRLRDLRNTHSDDALIHGMDQAMAYGALNFGYVNTVAQNNPEGRRRRDAPPPGRGAPKARHHGENSSAAAANRSKGTDVIDTPFSRGIERSLKQLEDMRGHVSDEEIEENYAAIMERAKEERSNA